MNTESLDPETDERMADLDSSGSAAPGMCSRLGSKKRYLLVAVLLAAGTVVCAVLTSLSHVRGSAESPPAQAGTSDAVSLSPGSSVELGVPEVSTAMPSADEPAANGAQTLDDDAAKSKRPGHKDSVLAQGIDAKIAESEDRMGQRLDQLSQALRSIEGQLEVVLAEMRSHPASRETQANSAAATDKKVTLLQEQVKNRDGAVVRLRQELAAREKVIADMTEATRRFANRPALPGWTVVGLTARSAAFRDLNGRTRVVATGEVIVDEVKLLGIDTASNRVNTSAGDMIYFGDTR